MEKLTHGFRFFFVQERGSGGPCTPITRAMDGDFNIENALAAIGVGAYAGGRNMSRWPRP